MLQTHSARLGKGKIHSFAYSVVESILSPEFKNNNNNNLQLISEMG